MILIIILAMQNVPVHIICTLYLILTQLNKTEWFCDALTPPLAWTVSKNKAL